jgi:hypothetical protein
MHGMAQRRCHCRRRSMEAGSLRQGITARTLHAYLCRDLVEWQRLAGHACFHQPGCQEWLVQHHRTRHGRDACSTFGHINVHGWTVIHVKSIRPPAITVHQTHAMRAHVHGMHTVVPAPQLVICIARSSRTCGEQSYSSVRLYAGETQGPATAHLPAAQLRRSLPRSDARLHNTCGRQAATHMKQESNQSNVSDQVCCNGAIHIVLHQMP